MFAGIPLLMGRISLFVVTGNPRPSPRKSLGISGLVSPGETFFRRIALYFPCGSGIPQRRRVRPGLPAPPLSLRHRRLPAHTVSRLRKSRDSAGFWARRFGNPKRRRRVRGPVAANAHVFLCCQVGRFGLALRRTASYLVCQEKRQRLVSGRSLSETASSRCRV